MSVSAQARGASMGTQSRKSAQGIRVKKYFRNITAVPTSQWPQVSFLFTEAKKDFFVCHVLTEPENQLEFLLKETMMDIENFCQ